PIWPPDENVGVPEQSNNGRAPAVVREEPLGSPWSQPPAAAAHAGEPEAVPADPGPSEPPPHRMNAHRAPTPAPAPGPAPAPAPARPPAAEPPIGFRAQIHVPGPATPPTAHLA